MKENRSMSAWQFKMIMDSILNLSFMVVLCAAGVVFIVWAHFSKGNDAVTQYIMAYLMFALAVGNLIDSIAKNFRTLKYYQAQMSEQEVESSKS